MTLRLWLLLLLFRQSLPVTLAAAPLAWGYVLLYPQVLARPEPFAPAVFIVVHAAALALVLGRPSSGWFAYVHTRGFTRRTLWAHLMLAQALAILVIWLPAATLIWLRGRSWLHDSVMQRPEFPVMASLEDTLPWRWLCLYGAASAMAAYAWIRNSLPVRGAFDGLWLAAAFGVAVLAMQQLGQWPPWATPLAAMALLVVAAVLLFAGYRTYSHMEIRA